VIAGIAAVAVIVAGTWLWMGRDDGQGAGADAPGAGPGIAVSDRTLALSVRGAAVPLIAVVGGGAPASVLTIPPRLSIEVPGVGSGSTEDVAAQTGAAMRASLSNTLGMWVDRYMVLDLDGLASAIDRAGGVTLTLSGPVTLGSSTVGPGPVTLSGAQVKEYLGVDGPFTRWEVVLNGITQAPIAVRAGDVLETDDLDRANAVLDGAGAASIATFPTTFVTGKTQVPDYEKLDALMVSRFGTPRPPVSVLVQNGAGQPGLAAKVAALIVPKGFRVVLSQNAEAFDHRRTEVVATGKEHVSDAERARKALGVGVLAVTEVPSGLADVTIVIGKDFTA
jgi:hypothetical protein